MDTYKEAQSKPGSVTVTPDELRRALSALIGYYELDKNSGWTLVADAKHNGDYVWPSWHVVKTWLSQQKGPRFR